MVNLHPLKSSAKRFHPGCAQMLLFSLPENSFISDQVQFFPLDLQNYLFITSPKPFVLVQKCNQETAICPLPHSTMSSKNVCCTHLIPSIEHSVAMLVLKRIKKAEPLPSPGLVRLSTSYAPSITGQI